MLRRQSEFEATVSAERGQKVRRCDVDGGAIGRQVLVYLGTGTGSGTGWSSQAIAAMRKRRDEIPPIMCKHPEPG